MNITRCDLCGGNSGGRMDPDDTICGRCVRAIVKRKTAVMVAAHITPAVEPAPTLSTCCGKPESVRPVSGLGARLVVECNHCGCQCYAEFL